MEEHCSVRLPLGSFSSEERVGVPVWSRLSQEVRGAPSDPVGVGSECVDEVVLLCWQ